MIPLEKATRLAAKDSDRDNKTTRVAPDRPAHLRGPDKAASDAHAHTKEPRGPRVDRQLSKEN